MAAIFCPNKRNNLISDAHISGTGCIYKRSSEKITLCSTTEVACMDPSRPAAPMEVAEAVGRLALNDCSCGQTNVQPDSEASLI